MRSDLDLDFANCQKKFFPVRYGLRVQTKNFKVSLSRWKNACFMQA